ncbi:MAG TPA: acetylglutamate kinase [Eubacteriaceae bacterium]|nr:acetylglutamate kinase [Eubacteriaceae bacterium]
MEKDQSKVTTLIEALPYIQRFNQKIVVIKYGGSAMTDEGLKESVVKDIVLMKLVGMKPVVVHGGGKKINELLEKVGKEPEFVDGLRVTDQETMELVEMVLSGNVNKNIVELFQKEGQKAVGISGKDGKTLIAQKKRSSQGKDIGFVGDITSVQTDLLKSLIEDDFVPVIASIATDAAGNTYNINADDVASAIAGALQAEKLIYLTDVEGVLKDVADQQSLISRIEIDEIEEYKSENIITGGMIPKIENCAKSVLQGVGSVHILDGRREHSLLLEIFTNLGIGTMIYKKERKQ